MSVSAFALSSICGCCEESATCLSTHRGETSGRPGLCIPSVDSPAVSCTGVKPGASRYGSVCTVLYGRCGCCCIDAPNPEKASGQPVFLVQGNSCIDDQAVIKNNQSNVAPGERFADKVRVSLERDMAAARDLARANAGAFRHFQVFSTGHIYLVGHG